MTTCPKKKPKQKKNINYRLFISQMQNIYDGHIVLQSFFFFFPKPDRTHIKRYIVLLWAHHHIYVNPQYIIETAHDLISMSVRCRCLRNCITDHNIFKIPIISGFVDLYLVRMSKVFSIYFFFLNRLQ